jgi:hypothetical protein
MPATRRYVSRRTASGCQRRIMWRQLGWVRLGYAALGTVSSVRFGLEPFTLVYCSLLPFSSVQFHIVQGDQILKTKKRDTFINDV